MRSSLISSFLIHHQQKNPSSSNRNGSCEENENIIMKEEQPIKAKNKISNDKKDGRDALIEKYQPDLVRDVPVNAIGSPETPSDYHHQHRNVAQEKDCEQSITNDDIGNNDQVLTTSDDYEHVEFVELEDEMKEEIDNDEEKAFANEDGENVALLLNDTTTKKNTNKKKICPTTKTTSGKTGFQKNKNNSGDNSDSDNKPPLSSDIKCFSLLKDLIHSVVTKPMTFYSRKGSKDGIKSHRSSSGDDDSSWEIKMEEINEMHWIGSGAQGAVFLGRWRNQEVAIKKVRTERDTDIKHLRDLDHKNIVKFR